MLELIGIIALKLPLMAVLMGVVPYLLGLFFVRDKSHPDALIRSYAYGFLAMFAIFEIVCVPLAYFIRSLTEIMVVYGVSVCALLLVSCVRYRGTLLKPLASFRDAARRVMTPGWAVAMAALFVFIAMATFLVHDNTYALVGDELYHIPAMNEAALRDITAGIVAETGRGMRFGVGSVPWRRLVAPQHLFYAMLSRIVHEKPAVVSQTLAVPFCIGWCYCAFWMLCRAIFPEDGTKMRRLFLFAMLGLVFLKINSASVPIATFARPWLGRSMLFGVMFTLVWERFLRRDMTELWLINLASMLCTTMTIVFLAPVEVLLYASCAVSDRRLMSPLKFFAAFVPQVLALLLLLKVGFK